MPGAAKRVLGAVRSRPLLLALCAAIVGTLVTYSCGGGSSGIGPLGVVPSGCVAQIGGGNGVRLERAFPALAFDFPVAMVPSPDGSHWWVIEKAGRVLQFPNTPGVQEPTLAADLTAHVESAPAEAGLLGIAFDPGFAGNGRVYLSYTRGGPLRSFLSRFLSRDGGMTLDPASEEPLLVVDQPYPNHNGGHILFGPDGYLYLGLGDGGSSGDPKGNGQNTNTLLGKLLRLDVSGGAYAIPPDNPFVTGGGRPEVYAYGLRNPWRFSFDRDTGQLWAADVGQNQWEEVDLITKGGNYGWSVMEGNHCFREPGCNRAGLIPPLAEYDHGEGCSITGGYLYRGRSLPALRGQYIYADFCSGTVWALDPANPSKPKVLVESGKSVTSFAEDREGELYLLDANSGGIYRLAAAAATASADFPDRLSETGCADLHDPALPSGEMFAYTINAPFWSDGAEKGRWMALPPGGQLQIKPDGDWEFPVGAVLRKDFALDGKLVETRLLAHRPDGRWTGYSYEWDTDQREAHLLKGGKEARIGSHRWIFPSPAQCLVCHTASAGYALGPDSGQMNRNGPDGTNQITALALGGRFAPPIPVAERLMRLPDPMDTGQPLGSRARAYLHSNCAQCHRPQGPTPSPMDFRFQRTLPEMGICNVTPDQGDMGIAGATLMSPGHPERSVIVLRMARRDTSGMPPLGSAIPDERGIALVSEWIASLSDCSPQ